MKKLSLAFSTLAIVIAWASPVHALTLPTTSSGVTVTVDGNGSYSIATKSPSWTFGGALGTALSRVKSSSGKDRIGSYVQATFDWTSGVPLSGSIRAYQASPVVLFSYTARQAGSIGASFPNFTIFPRNPYKFSYRNARFIPYSFSAQPGTSPWAFFDTRGNTFIVSPASDFFISAMSGDGASTIASGLNGQVPSYPVGFTHRSMLVVGKGIGDTFRTWGLSLTNYYGKTRPENTADTLLKYLSYWTDNGATYYYRYDPALGYAGTLLDLAAYFRQQGIPVRSMQLDSWWYPKTNEMYDGAFSDPVKNRHFPAQSWNCYGGCMLYQASSDLFPNGLGSFQRSLGLPLVTHGRWINQNSPYHKPPYDYLIDGVTPVDGRYWNGRMRYLAENGVRTYEQDWLDYMYRYSPETWTTVDQGPAFLDNMATAASRNGVTLQYCMPMPLHYLQGAKYSNLTTVRVSDDRFRKSDWDHELYASVLAGSLGEWPWSDVFDSTETDNLLLSTLTAGPVGFGDAKGAESKSNLLLAVRADGRIVKPDRPAVPSDATFIADASTSGLPLVAWTCTRQHRQTDYVFCEQRGTDSVSFDPQSMGIAGPSFVYDFFAKTARIVPAGGTYVDSIPAGGYKYYVIGPIDSTGIAFLGDAGKFVGTGKARIARLSGLAGARLTATVLIAPSDGPIVLHGYSVVKPSVSSPDGRVSDVGYSASTHYFTFTVRPAPGARTKIVDGNPVYTVTVSMTGARGQRPPGAIFR